jgi:hypothetical protein
MREKTKNKLLEQTYMPTSGVAQEKKTHIASGSFQRMTSFLVQ